MIKDTYNFLGRIIYYLSILPLRIYLGRSKRVYGLLVYGDEFLLIKNWYSRQDWRLPGGGVKANESSEQALEREISEEIGINLDSENFIQLTEGRWRPDKANFEYQIFLIKVADKPLLKPRRLEIIGHDWFEINKTPANLPNEISQALKRVKLVNKA